MPSVIHFFSTLLHPWIFKRFISDWNREGFFKYLKNTGWVAIARLTTLVLSFLTIAVVARYLGPENFGKLSYAQSFVSLFSAFAALGIDQILFRDLIAYPDKEAELLGTAFVARLLCGAATIVVTITTAYLINTEPVLTWMIGILTLSFLFQPFGIIAHYFSARVQSKYIAYTSIFTAFSLPVLKLAVVYYDEGILYLTAIVTLETILYAGIYCYIYVQVCGHSIRTWTFSATRLGALLNESWPLLLAGFSGYIYGRIDQVMIQHFLDSSAVGLYDITVRLTELLGFLPGIIIASLFPAIINARNVSTSEYQKRLRALTIMCLSLSVVSVLVLTLLAPFIITLLFGADYMAAIPLLRIYVWSTVGTIGIILMQQYLIAEHHSQLFLFFSIIGAVTNVVLNLFFIPAFGMNGAAYATLLTLAIILTVFLAIKHTFTSETNHLTV